MCLTDATNGLSVYIHTFEYFFCIAAHSNCVLFITHGGLLSSTETVHFGVPIIGIPTFADQFSNIGTAVDRGFAKKVDLSYSLAEDLGIAIKDILGDPK